ncbi:MAG: M20 family metallopeptidase [Clostridia bacterium]|nr:M20 family metallopeptidase [Clostridia bacterium]MBQ6868273.1 M20 family metallopeptidase [Clostridia bacterium]
MINELKNKAFALAEENIDLYNHICDEIFKHPEMGNEEYYSSKFLVEEMEKRGFRVQYPYGGLDTAFRCEIGEGSPKIAFLAEYDALPGYGPNKDQPGHACGHNWIAACTFGAADVLAQLKEHFNGTIVYIGTPAEEGTGGKVDLVNAGCFEDIDAAFQMHLTGAEKTELNGSSLAIDSLEFTFEGKAAHAAGAPWDGINALDAAYLMINGINALRQHVKPDTRIHGIIAEGGMAPNIVPNHAVYKVFCRAADRDYLNTVTQKVINCAKGAELMTGATMSYRYYENSFDNLNCNPVLVEVMANNLTAMGYTNFGKEKKEPSGSTDLGNVSRVVPTCYVSLNVENTDGSTCHNEAFLAHVNGELAYKANLTAIKAMAASAIDVLLNEEIRNAIAK